MEVCKEQEKVCDWGSDRDGYKYGCNTIAGIMTNRLRCLNNFDVVTNPYPLDGPRYQAVCAPAKFSLSGFHIFFGEAVKVY